MCLAKYPEMCGGQCSECKAESLGERIYDRYISKRTGEVLYVPRGGTPPEDSYKDPDYD